ncbi:MAG: peptide ABC transporter substrate-binding protein [Phycisphaerales bacterium]
MRWIGPLLFVGLALIGVAALDRGDRRADLVVAHRADVFTLDPQRMSYQQDLRVAEALYETLVVLDPVECRPMPGTAESWTRSDDGRTYTFAIRRDARWSNGDPVVADDFIEAWFRAIVPDLAADYTGLFFLIDGAEAFFRWRADELARFVAEDASRGDPDAGEALLAASRRRFAETVGLSAPDDRTLVVRLARPTPYLLDVLAVAACAPVHRATVARFTTVDPATGRIQVDHGWTRPGTLVGNGPYELERWRYKRDMRLRRNPHYWNAANVRAETIDVLPIEDANTSILAFDAGGIDWHTDVVVEYRADLLEQRRRYEERWAAQLGGAAPGSATGSMARSATASSGDPSPGAPADRPVAADLVDRDVVLGALPAPDARRGERRNVAVFDSFGTDFYSFNCRPKLADGGDNPFADARVRRAFALAVDKELLVEQVTRLHERVSGSITPRGGIVGYDPPVGLGFDPDRARRELADAGWADRDGDGLVEDAAGRAFPTVDLLYSTGNPRYEDLSLALRDMWQRELGVSVELRSKEAKFAKNDLQKGNFMIARGGWYGDFGDPMTFLLSSRTGDGNNDRGFANPRFDAMLDAANDEADPARRFAMLREAERLLVEEELPFVPLCTYVQVYMYEPGKLHGLTRHPKLEQYLGRMWVEK